LNNTKKLLVAASVVGAGTAILRARSSGSCPAGDKQIITLYLEKYNDIGHLSSALL
jgi:hypothetical protein